jgi:hypothetical protein
LLDFDNWEGIRGYSSNPCTFHNKFWFQHETFVWFCYTMKTMNFTFKIVENTKYKLWPPNTTKDLVKSIFYCSEKQSGNHLGGESKGTTALIMVL